MVLLAGRLPGEDHPFNGRLMPLSPRVEDEGCRAAVDLDGLRNQADERLLEGLHHPEHEGPDVALPVGVVLPQVPGEGVGLVAAQDGGAVLPGPDVPAVPGLARVHGTPFRKGCGGK